MLYMTAPLAAAPGVHVSSGRARGGKAELIYGQHDDSSGDTNGGESVFAEESVPGGTDAA